MKKQKLYNWYGHEFDVKVDFLEQSKSYKTQINNLYNRKLTALKEHKKNQKILFIKAKTNLEDKRKKEIATLKTQYKLNKKVLKESIHNLKFANNILDFINYEIKKLDQEQKELVAYLDNYFKFIKNTADSYNSKVKNITDLKEKTRKKEIKILVNKLYLMILYKFHKKYPNENFVLDKIQSLNLESEEKNFLNSNHFSYQQLINLNLALVHKQKELLNRKKEIKAEYLKSKSTKKIQYKNELQTIKNNSKAAILENEYSFSQEMDQKLNDIKQEKTELKQKLKNINNKISEFKNNSGQKYKDHLNKIKLEKKKINKSFWKKIFINLKIIKTQLLIEKYNLDNNKDKTAVTNLFTNIKRNYAEIAQSNFKNPKIKNKKKEIKQDLKDLKTILFKNKKIEKSFHPYKLVSKFNKYSLSIKKLANQKYLHYSKLYKDVSYDSDFYQNKAEFGHEYVKNMQENIAIYDHEFKTAINKINLLKSGNEYQNQTKILKEEKHKLKQQYKSKILKLKNNYKNKELAKKAYINARNYQKILYKESISELKIKNEVTKTKNILKTILPRYLAKRKIAYKIYESKVTESSKTIPKETNKNLKFIAPILNLVLPGISELLFFKQFKKGIMLMLVSVFLYAVFLPFSLGLTYTKIGGVQGLIDLGAGIHDFSAGIVPDARYYLFGGVISVFMLTMLVAFNIVSSIGAYKTARDLVQGLRPSVWSNFKKQLQTNGFPWIISLPGWFLIVFIVISPIVTSLLISFTNMGFNHEPPGKVVDWEGLNQYGKWWRFKDVGMALSLFRVLSWTIIWTLVTTPLVIGVGTLFAILANNQRIKMKKLFRMIYIIPWAIPAFVTIIFLKSAFLADSDSLINLILLKTGIIQEPINWWSSIWTIRILLIVIQVWLGHSYIFLLVTGNIQSIPKDIYEAGSIDGARRSQMFRYLTVPALLAGIAPLLITQFSFTFNNFAIISLFSGGGPAYADPTPFLEGGTDILISWVYKLTTSIAQIDGNTGFAAAMTIVAALISISFSAYGFAKSVARGDR
ncbi:ABC transporter permease subunit [Candidatus Mycoplasma pogonae]